MELLESKLNAARKDESGAGEKIRRFSTRVSKVTSQMSAVKGFGLTKTTSRIGFSKLEHLLTLCSEVFTGNAPVEPFIKSSSLE